MEKGIFESDPFVQLDQRGVGALMNTASIKCHKANDKAKVIVNINSSCFCK